MPTLKQFFLSDELNRILINGIQKTWRITQIKICAILALVAVIFFSFALKQ